MRAIKTFTITFIIIALSVSAACAAAKTKIALLMSGTPQETKESFNFMCASGLKEAQREIGAKKITAGYFNALDDDGQLLPFLEKAASESELAIITSKKYLPYIDDVEKKYPHCKLLVFCGSADVNENDKRNILLRDEEAGFLAASAASLLNVSGDNFADKTIGIITGRETSADKRLCFGFRAGAWYIDKRIKTEYARAQNEEEAQSALLQMHNNGADVIFICNAQPSLLELCRSNKITAIITDPALQKRYPETALLSIVKHPKYVIKSAVQKYMSKKLPDDYRLMRYAREKGDIYSFGVSDYVIEIMQWSPEAKKLIPPVTRRKIELVEAKLGYRLLKIQRIECEALNERK